jgi:hypothetical protein
MSTFLFVLQCLAGFTLLGAMLSVAFDRETRSVLYPLIFISLIFHDCLNAAGSVLLSFFKAIWEILTVLGPPTGNAFGFIWPVLAFLIELSLAAIPLILVSLWVKNKFFTEQPETVPGSESSTVAFEDLPSTSVASNSTPVILKKRLKKTGEGISEPQSVATIEVTEPAATPPDDEPPSTKPGSFTLLRKIPFRP